MLGHYKERSPVAGRFGNTFHWAVMKGKVWTPDIKGKGQKEPREQ